jgi:hypothetical protein
VKAGFPLIPPLHERCGLRFPEPPRWFLTGDYSSRGTARTW